MEATMTPENAPASTIYRTNDNVNLDNRAAQPASLHSQQAIPRNGFCAKNLIVEKSGKELGGVCSIV